MNETRHEHPDDGALLRSIDEPGGAEEIAAHLAGCRICADRQAQLRDRSTRLTTLLANADAPAPPLPAAALRARQRRFSLSPAMGVAAALVVLLIGTVVVPPVRAVLIDGLRRVLQEEPVTPSDPRPRADVAPAGIDTSAIVSFSIAGSVFRLTVEHQQDTGVVSFVRGDGTLASAAITGPYGTESLIVQANGLRVLNTAESRTSYRIALPHHVNDIVVHVADHPAKHLTTPVTDSVVVDLEARN